MWFYVFGFVALGRSRRSTARRLGYLPVDESAAEFNGHTCPPSSPAAAAAVQCTMAVAVAGGNEKCSWRNAPTLHAGIGMRGGHNKSLQLRICECAVMLPEKSHQFLDTCKLAFISLDDEFGNFAIIGIQRPKEAHG
jgi:hypothetical protein